ncbi:MAG TPA: ribbon-helix-helix domain-containing protein [Stellaceae bacterium]|nr:ribbon-helix-helix domain-containing protein [Stellaceae bacterium]
MPHRIRKRSVTIAGHATSVTVEDAFWQDLRRLARRRGLSLNALIGSVDAARDGSLSSALRLLVLEGYRGGELGPSRREDDGEAARR